MEARKGFKDTVAAMVGFLEERLDVYKDELPSLNPFTGLDIEVGDYRIKQPWLFIDQIAEGKAGPIGYPTSKKKWEQVVSHVMKKDMFNVGPAPTEEAADDEGGDWDDLDEAWALLWPSTHVDLDSL